MEEDLCGNIKATSVCQGRIYMQRGLLLGCVFFQELNYIANVYEFEDILVFDFNAEFIFADHNHISKLDRVDTKVVCEVGLKSDIIRVELQLFYEQVLQSFKHNFMSSNNFSFWGKIGASRHLVYYTL